MRCVRNHNEAAMTLIEVLVALTVVSIIAIGINLSAISSLRIAKKTEVNYMASNLALSKVEDLAAVDPSELDDTYDTTETGLGVTGMDFTFRRVTDITVNGDDSRTVTVLVTSENSAIPTQSDFTTRFSLWE